MTIAPQRLLGFAFAGADLLLEIERDGAIGLAIGASEALSGSSETALVGRAWRDFVDPRDQEMIEALLVGLKEGRRGGPVTVQLASAADGVERAASMSAFRMPGSGGGVSCVFSRAGGRVVHDLHDISSFEATAATLMQNARSTGQDLEIALLELAGFAAMRDSLPPDAAMALDRKLNGALRSQSHGGASAAAFGSDRFALVRAKGDAAEALVERLSSMLGTEPSSGLRASARLMALKADASPAQIARAIRFSLDSFIADGLTSDAPIDLNTVVNRSIHRTLSDIDLLGAAVNDRQFKLAFQPVVTLSGDPAPHHFEVLVRFGDNGSPYPMIRMAEELDMIESLDLAIVDQTIARLAAQPGLKLAANVSGRTIVSSGFVEAVRQRLAKTPSAAGRLLLEITESAAIDDLALADRHLAALRREGCVICLDDFGAGAASLAYLQQLTLDIVKIDGRFIRELQHGGRESAFIRQLVRLCASLKVLTIAEMVETTAAEDAVRRAGVDFAQGWLYGAAGDLPRFTHGPTLSGSRHSAARRTGTVDSWG